MGVSIKRILKGIALALPLFLATAVPAFADEASGMAPAPEGAMAFVVIIPLVVIIALLIMKVDMLIAGLAGGALAMVIGGIGIADLQAQLLETVPSMLSNTAPIINSAVATAVFKSGGYMAALMLVRRAVGERTWIMAAFIVLLQSAATYMSGIGGGSAMVIAPLAFAALGAIPELIAGMCVATAVCFTTSPASLETSMLTQFTGASVNEYVDTIRIITLLFVAVGVGIAVFGAIRRKAVFVGAEDEEFKDMTTADLVRTMIPAVFLLFAVIGGPFINSAVGMPVLGTAAYMIITVALIGMCTKFTFNESCQAFIDGSSYILTRLLGVAVFLAFINVIRDTGAFTSIVNVAQTAPAFLLVPAMILAGFLIGFPAGAYVGSILALILPIAVSLGFSLFEVGLVTIGVGFGSQIAYVNITMQAMSSGFQIPIDKVVKGNLPWVAASLAVLLVLGFVL